MNNPNCKHIAIVANTSWYIFNFRHNLVEKLMSKGYHVTSIAPFDRYSQMIKEIGCEYININIDNNGKNPLKDLKTLFDFCRIYSQIRPAVILHYTTKPNIYGSVAARLAKIPFINNISGLGSTFIHKGVTNLIVRILYQLSQGRSHKVFFQNPDDFKLFTQSRLVRSDKVDLLPGSGVDLHKFFPQKKERTQKFCFLLIARLLWEKGVKEYVEAARILRESCSDLEFQLLGFVENNNPRSVSEKQIRDWEQEGCVIWLGSVEDVRPHIAEADCVVLPSYYREGTPRSLLEAASMGKPLITTDAIGCRQVVDEGVNGFLCKQKDSFDLASVMQKMLRLTDEQRMAMGKKGREKMVREFDEQIVISKYLETIEEVTKPITDFITPSNTQILR